MATTSKPTLPSLKTPLSASYPSELRSPFTPHTTHFKREADLPEKTPITPPAAYLDFISKLSPTPRANSCSSTSTTSTTTDSRKPSPPASSSIDKAFAPPPLPQSARLPHTSSSSSAPTPQSARLPPATPTSPFAHPHSARTPRRLVIPPASPYSPASMRSPLGSAASVYSPYSAGAYSAGLTSGGLNSGALASPRDGEGKTRAVSVRQVVTRTVTYSRPAVREGGVLVEPVPVSRKRKVEG
ncbi:hypothetical protein EJ06DRAFT_535319 [Trichodelitschia bisporula]|uniref:Uncharacterized protein n=1 Tax=Trichodelitschia bisporula TaxID=703511 RepID=A0A6G1IBG3_9PEZI|nr:hypothetical protein EJ06DRAFT_535319 [Trichodelitschia bisporula]